MKTKEEILEAMELSGTPWLPGNVIFMSLAGSRLYGTNTEDSDYDYRGICIPPMRYYVGLENFEQTQCHNDEVDVTIFGIKKFVKLALDCNPNIIELLFIPQECTIYKHENGFMDVLMYHADKFVTRKAENTFLGYAFSQLKRIKTHKKWIDNIPERPDREEMGLPKQPRLSGDKRRSLFTLSDEDLDILGCSSDMKKEIRGERQYHTELENWKRYDDWKRNRNPARAELEKKSGYDTKHAMHLFRLLNMAEEIAESGTIKVRRDEDLDFLLDIRNGKFDYEQLIDMANKKEVIIRSKFESSGLPKKPNHREISELMGNLIIDFNFDGVVKK